MFMGLLLVLFWIVCILIVASVLIQTGKESGFAGAFGAGGGGQTAFGARAGSFLTRITAGLGGVFMILAFVLVIVGSHAPRGNAPDEVVAAEDPAAGQTVDWIEDTGATDDATEGGFVDAPTETEGAPAETETAPAEAEATPADAEAEPGDTDTAPAE